MVKNHATGYRLPRVNALLNIHPLHWQQKTKVIIFGNFAKYFSIQLYVNNNAQLYVNNNANPKPLMVTQFFKQ